MTETQSNILLIVATVGLGAVMWCAISAMLWLLAQAYDKIGGYDDE